MKLNSRRSGLLLVALAAVIVVFSEDIKSLFDVYRLAPSNSKKPKSAFVRSSKNDSTAPTVSQANNSTLFPTDGSLPQTSAPTADSSTNTSSPSASFVRPPFPSISPTTSPSTVPSVSPSDSTITSNPSDRSSTLPQADSPTESTPAHDSPLLSYSRCMNRVFYDKLPALISKLNSDPNGLALQPLVLNYTVNGTAFVEEPVDGFDLSVLHGRRMVLLGDSTLFYPHKFLYQVMVQQHDRWQNLTASSSSSSPNAITLFDANKLLFEQEPWMNFSLNIKNKARFGLPKPILLPNDTTTLIEWVGMSGLASNDLEGKLNAMHASARRIQPHVIVANMGLHWLQVCAFSDKQCPTELATVKRVVYYEESWLQSVIDTAMEVNASLVLFKTTNYISASARTGAWAKWDRRLQRFRPKDVNLCMRHVYQLLVVASNSSGSVRGNNLTDAQIKEYCMYSQYTEVGAKYLNDRLQAFVEEYNTNKQNQAMAVGIFNDHDLEINALTTDGIHHPFIALLRLRLLINTIQSYDKCIHIPKNTTFY